MTQWIERWHGSGPDRGWWVWETGHGDPIAYVGEGDHSMRLTSIIVQKHNAAIPAVPPGQQQESVTDAMVEQAWAALRKACPMLVGSSREGMRAALTAALTTGRS